MEFFNNACAVSRRAVLAASLVTLSCGTLLGSATVTLADDNTLIVRTSSGGAYGAAMEEAIFAPFTAETGIKIEKISIDMAPLMASGVSGEPLADVVDTAEGILQNFAAKGALQSIDYSKLTSFTLDDIGADAAQEQIVRRMVYARVIGYSKAAVKGKAPTDWAEFWDVDNFPGARALSGLDLNMPDLEFALLADGVAMDKLYPLDIDRALAAYGRIRDKVQSFYGTDAISANLLATGEAEVLSIANGRIQTAINEGGDYAIEWNQHMKMPSAYSIMNGSKKAELAHKFINYAMSPEVQARFAEKIPYGPVNKKAFDLLSPEVAKTLATNPEWSDKGFMQDALWWGANSTAVAEAWNKWSAQ